MATPSAGTSSGGTTPTTAEAQSNPIVVVEWGKEKSRKNIKGLRKGRGKLYDRVEDLIAEMTEKGVISKNAQPVVVVVREKSDNAGWAL